MSDAKSDNVLVELLDDFRDALERQLTSDYERWGDTWKHRPREGQEERIMQDILNYFDQYKFAGHPIPWLKIAGLAHIALVRENTSED